MSALRFLQALKDFAGGTKKIFLRSKKRFKDSKAHRYQSVVEHRRVVQRQLLFLGEVNNWQEAMWGGDPGGVW